MHFTWFISAARQYRYCLFVYVLTANVLDVHFFLKLYVIIKVDVVDIVCFCVYSSVCMCAWLNDDIFYIVEFYITQFHNFDGLRHTNDLPYLNFLTISLRSHRIVIFSILKSICMDKERNGALIIFYCIQFLTNSLMT